MAFGMCSLCLRWVVIVYGMLGSIAVTHPTGPPLTLLDHHSLYWTITHPTGPSLTLLDRHSLSKAVKLVRPKGAEAAAAALLAAVTGQNRFSDDASIFVVDLLPQVEAVQGDGRGLRG